MTRFRLHIEESKCWGCKTCEVACKQEHAMPDGVPLIRVSEDGPRETDGQWHFEYRVNRCRHCDEPLCVEACPVGALEQRTDGVVVLERAFCIGCQACIEVCPHGGVIFDRGSTTVAKCELCHRRLDAGLLPACADNVCPAHCIHLLELEGEPL